MRVDPPCLRREHLGGCAADHCVDHHVDGDETGVDCGGSTCAARCAPGSACLGQTDCTSQVCTGHVCAAPACNDGVVNGSEADVDCGGGCSLACSVGQHCWDFPDCASTACDVVNHVCVANHCLDNFTDGDETSTDCGGPTCGPCPSGALCAVASDCASNVCDPLYGNPIYGYVCQ